MNRLPPIPNLGADVAHARPWRGKQEESVCDAGGVDEQFRHERLMPVAGNVSSRRCSGKERAVSNAHEAMREERGARCAGTSNEQAVESVGRGESDGVSKTVVSNVSDLASVKLHLFDTIPCGLGGASHEIGGGNGRGGEKAINYRHRSKSMTVAQGPSDVARVLQQSVWQSHADTRTFGPFSSTQTYS